MELKFIVLYQIPNPYPKPSFIEGVKISINEKMMDIPAIAFPNPQPIYFTIKY
jgi:hypothetical protein